MLRLGMLLGVWPIHFFRKVFMSYTIIDKRRSSPDYKEPEVEVCRVCGSKEVHSTKYNQPTMGCIEHYRTLLQHMKEKL